MQSRWLSHAWEYEDEHEMIKSDKNGKQVKLNMVNTLSFQIQIKFNLIIFRNFLRPSNFRQLESA